MTNTPNSTYDGTWGGVSTTNQLTFGHTTTLTLVQNSTMTTVAAVTDNLTLADNTTFYPIPESIPLASKLVLVVLYTFTTMASVVGNSLAIIVFAQGKRSKTDLRPFLINLSVADLIMAIFCIPFTFEYEISNHWIFSKPMCHIVQCCQLVSVTASVCTNTFIGIDRLIAVKFPLRKRVTSSRSKLAIGLVWIFAWCMGVIPLVMGNTREEGGKIKCEEKWPDDQSHMAYSFFVMIVTYFLPVTILTGTYTMIGHQLWNRNIPGHANDLRDAQQLKSKKKVVKMLSTVVLLFGVCWLPLHLFFIIISFNPYVFGGAVDKVYFGVHWLSMANSFVNPVIYGFMNDNFRADLRNVCQSCLCRRVQRGCINRSPAMRWRMAHNVHSASFSLQSQPALATKSLFRHELEMKAATKPMLWQNGHSKSSRSLEPNSDTANSVWRPAFRDERKGRYGLVRNSGDGDSGGSGNGGGGGDAVVVDMLRNNGCDKNDKTHNAKQKCVRGKVSSGDC